MAKGVVETIDFISQDSRLGAQDVAVAEIGTGKRPVAWGDRW